MSLPSIALLATVLAGREDIAFGGDQAVIELGTREAGSVGRTLGPYSRYGWNHPGPLWLYLLAVPYRMLGGGSVALYAGVLLLHAMVAALVVLAIDRWAGRPASAVAAGGVLLAGLVLGGEIFRTVWNPYALLLPLLLLLVLAAAAASGSVIGLSAAALVSTFLVQTHVGTVPAVAAVAIVSGLAFVVVYWRAGHPRPSRREAVGAGALLLVTVAAWLPPAVQELRPGTGNVAQMRLFAELDLPGQTWDVALATVGNQLLALPSFGSTQALPEAAATLGAEEVAALAVFGGLCAGLAVLGVRRRRAFPVALVGLSLVCGAASVVAVREVDGEVYPYLVLWQAMLPVPLLVAAAALAGRSGGSRPSAPSPRPTAPDAPPRRGTLVSAAVVVTVATVVAAGQAVAAPPVSEESRLAVAPAVAAVAPALPEPGAGPVRIRIGFGGAWQVASGVILALERQGYDVHVTEDWTFMFGLDDRPTGREPTEVMIVGRPELRDLPRLTDAREVGAVDGPEGRLLIVVRRADDGAAVPPLPFPVTGKFIQP